jgi:hypothetical protein
MVKKAKKRLVNHKVYCGKLYARIGGQFKQIDITVQDIANLRANQNAINDGTLDIEKDKTYKFAGRKWHIQGYQISRTAGQFARMDLEAICPNELTHKTACNPSESLV